MKIWRRRSAPEPRRAPLTPEQEDLLRHLHTRHVSLRAAHRLSKLPSSKEMLSSLRDREVRAAELVNQAMSSHPARQTPEIQLQVAHLESSFAELAQLAGEMLQEVTMVEALLGQMLASRPVDLFADGSPEEDEGARRLRVRENQAIEKRIDALVERIDGLGARMGTLLAELGRDRPDLASVDRWEPGQFRVNSREMGVLGRLALEKPDLYDRYMRDGPFATATFVVLAALHAAAPVVLAASVGAYAVQKAINHRSENEPSRVDHRHRHKEERIGEVREVQLHLAEAVSVFSSLSTAYGVWNDRGLLRNSDESLRELALLSARFEALEASYERRSAERKETVLRMQDLVDAVEEQALLNRAIGRLSGETVSAVLSATGGPTHEFFEELRRRLDESSSAP